MNVSVLKNSLYRPESAASYIDAAAAGNLSPVRRAAFEQLKARGLPTAKLERFKFTNLLKFEKAQLTPGPSGLAPLDDKYLTNTPAEAFPDQMLWALNTLHTQGGLLVDKSGTYKLLHKGCEGMLQSPRLVINVPENGQVTIIEKFVGAGAVNHVADITVGRGGKLVYVREQAMDADAMCFTGLHAAIKRDASCDVVFLNTGASLSRADMWYELDEPGASAYAHGAQLITGDQVMDTTILIDHKAPNCGSNQKVRNVLNDRARGVFQGKVHVHQPAQKTDGYQLCNTIMLSDKAEMNTKPELEIYADDVKCSHGTTTGSLDETPLFYMRSRGIPEASARRLMLQSFVNESFDVVGDDEAREALVAAAETWLDHEVA